MTTIKINVIIVINEEYITKILTEFSTKYALYP